MKKSFYIYKTLPLLIGFVFLVFACRKERKIEIPEGYEAGVSCSNGIKDGS